MIQPPIRPRPQGCFQACWWNASMHDRVRTSRVSNPGAGAARQWRCSARGTPVPSPGREDRGYGPLALIDLAVRKPQLRHLHFMPEPDLRQRAGCRGRRRQRDPIKQAALFGELGLVVRVLKERSAGAVARLLGRSRLRVFDIARSIHGVGRRPPDEHPASSGIA